MMNYKFLQDKSIGILHPDTGVVGILSLGWISRDLKDQVHLLFNHINQMDAHIRFTMEPLDSEGSIPFLDTKLSPYCNSTIYIAVGRKPTHTDRYLD